VPTLTRACVWFALKDFSSLKESASNAVETASPATPPTPPNAYHVTQTTFCHQEIFV
jgi:hypothetical protein